MRARERRHVIGEGGVGLNRRRSAAVETMRVDEISRELETPWIRKQQEQGRTQTPK